MLNGLIYTGRTLFKMSENPLHSKDMNYGQPLEWIDTMNEIYAKYDIGYKSQKSYSEVQVDGATSEFEMPIVVPNLDLSALAKKNEQTPDQRERSNPFKNASDVSTPNVKTGRFEENKARLSGRRNNKSVSYRESDLIRLRVPNQLDRNSFLNVSAPNIDDKDDVNQTFDDSSFQRVPTDNDESFKTQGLGVLHDNESQMERELTQMRDQAKK